MYFRNHADSFNSNTSPQGSFFLPILFHICNFPSSLVRTLAPYHINNIIRIRAEINEVENRKSIEKVNETKSWSFEKISKINKPQVRLNKKKKERTLLKEKNKLLISVMKEGTLQQSLMDIKRIIKEYYE